MPQGAQLPVPRSWTDVVKSCIPNQHSKAINYKEWIEDKEESPVGPWNTSPTSSSDEEIFPNTQIVEKKVIEVDTVLRKEVFIETNEDMIQRLFNAYERALEKEESLRSNPKSTRKEINIANIITNQCYYRWIRKIGK